MKVLEVYVSAVDKQYDFRLDENTPLALLAEEICEMVCQYEQCVIHGETSALLFYKWGDNHTLPMNDTIQNIGLHTGDRLVLI